MDSIPSGVPLSKIPTLKPPPGVKSNFVDPPSLANAIIAVSVVFLALMLIALTVRIYTKWILLRSLWWDDCECQIGCQYADLKTQADPICKDTALIAAVSFVMLKSHCVHLALLQVGSIVHFGVSIQRESPMAKIGISPQTIQRRATDLEDINGTSLSPS